MRTKKRFGQNFLVDENYVNKIVTALHCHPDDIIVEIGPGMGSLTNKIINSVSRFVAIEIDRDLHPLLIKNFGNSGNFELVKEDALKIDFNELIESERKLKLVANLPYNISTAILQKLIEQRDVFSEMVLMFQKEVVERITADVGKKERGYLTVLTEAYLKTEKLFDVPPTAFKPIPKVWSSVVRLETKKESEIGIENENLFKEIVGLGFGQKRKTIQNNLKNAPAELKKLFERKGGIVRVLEKSGIEINQRAETIGLENWKGLCNFLVGKTRN